MFVWREMGKEKVVVEKRRTTCCRVDAIPGEPYRSRHERRIWDGPLRTFRLRWAAGLVDVVRPLPHLVRRRRHSMMKKRNSSTMIRSSLWSIGFRSVSVRRFDGSDATRRPLPEEPHRPKWAAPAFFSSVVFCVEHNCKKKWKRLVITIVSLHGNTICLDRVEVIFSFSKPTAVPFWLVSFHFCCSFFRSLWICSTFFLLFPSWILRPCSLAVLMTRFQAATAA